MVKVSAAALPLITKVSPSAPSVPPLTMSRPSVGRSIGIPDDGVVAVVAVDGVDAEAARGVDRRASMLTLSPVSRLEATKRTAAFAVNGPVPNRLRLMLRAALSVVLLIRSTWTKVTPSREKNTVIVSCRRAVQSGFDDRVAECRRRRAGKVHVALDLRAVEVAAAPPMNCRTLLLPASMRICAGGDAPAVAAFDPVGAPGGGAVGIALVRGVEVVGKVRRCRCRSRRSACRCRHRRSACRHPRRR